MINKVRETISSKGLLEKGDRVLVAFSGGADSKVLLHILLSLKEEMGLTIYAAHVNHNIRGEEALADENFVRGICEKYNVELFCKSVDIPKLSRAKGESEELCGRNVRYEFFSEISEKLSAKIATAHTLSDCEETMLYNISRGTSLHGLCSIPYRRDNIVRPLLDASREEVEAYAAENYLNFVSDSSNFSEDYCKRNKIRLSVLPPLKSLNEGFHENFRRLRNQLSETDSFMRDRGEEALDNAGVKFGYSAVKLLKNHPAVLKKALAVLLESEKVSPTQRHIELLCEILNEDGAVPLTKEKTAVCKQGVLRIVKDMQEDSFEICPMIPMEFTCFDKEYSLKEISAQEINKKLSPNLVDYDKMTVDTVLRTRREGDTFAPLGRGLTKSLRKLQNELKIPSEEREKSLLLARESKILWAEHLGVSEDGAVDDTTEKAFIIDIKGGK